MMGVLEVSPKHLNQTVWGSTLYLPCLMIVEGPVMMGSLKSQCPCTPHLRGIGWCLLHQSWWGSWKSQCPHSTLMALAWSSTPYLPCLMTVVGPVMAECGKCLHTSVRLSGVHSGLTLSDDSGGDSHGGVLKLVEVSAHLNETIWGPFHSYPVWWQWWGQPWWSLGSVHTACTSMTLSGVHSVLTLSDDSGRASHGRVLKMSAHLTETIWGVHSVLYLSGVSSGASHGGVLEVSTQHTP